ncbi:MAG: glycosyltransferase family 2 protein [Bilophila wadsworthia]
MKTLTIAVPTYNMERWLPVTIESCLWQSHKSIEILIVNDGSTDASGEIADRYAKLDSRVRHIHKPNGGHGSARQRGQDEAAGDFITWLDADDFLDPMLRKRCLKRRRGTKWIWSAATRSSSLTKHSTRAAISPIPPRQGSPFPPPRLLEKQVSGGGYSPSPFCVPERTAARSSIQVISSGRTYASCSKLCHA